MFRFILRRLYYGFLVMLGVITLIFILFNILPGDPARMMLGQRADLKSVQLINRELGRDKPLIQQYFKFINDLSPLSLHNNSDTANYWYLDHARYGKTLNIINAGHSTLVMKEPYLRRSYQSNRSVTSIISEAFPNTLLLALVAVIFAFIAGVSLGTVCAVKKDSFFDRAALVISALGMSIPSFFAAVIIAWVFAFLLADYTGLNMTGSLYSVDDFGEGEFLDIKNLILPAITLGIRPLAVITELTRSSVLEVLSQDYIRTAKAKGLRFRKIIMRHVMKNALNPVFTAVSGWFASLMAGAVFVEYVFDWKGIGVVIVESLEKYDFPVVMGSVLYVAVILVLINIIMDIIYSILDPRIKIIES